MAVTSPFAQAQSVGFIGDLSGGCAAVVEVPGVLAVFTEAARQRGIEVKVEDTFCYKGQAPFSVQRLVIEDVDFAFAFTASPAIGEVLKNETREQGLFAIVFVAVRSGKGEEAALAAAGAWSDVHRRFGSDGLYDRFQEVNAYLQEMFWSRYASN